MTVATRFARTTPALSSVTSASSSASSGSPSVRRRRLPTRPRPLPTRSVTRRRRLPTLPAAMTRMRMRTKRLSSISIISPCHLFGRLLMPTTPASFCFHVRAMRV